MRERKYVKFRVDMYDDTKFKIIDMKPERDLIHYVWTRLVTLAGKVNLEGDLYLSKNIPYTMETLAIEFNRSIDQIKSALDVLTELEMIEFSENKIYRVKNFAKHQNIKVNEKIKSKVNNNNNNNNDDAIKNKEVSVSENINSIIIDNKDNKSSGETKTSSSEVTNVKINDKNSSQSDYNVIDKKTNTTDKNSELQNNIPIPLQTKKIKKINNNKKKNNSIDVTDENTEENLYCCFSDVDEERPLGEGEQVVGAWSF